MAKRKETGTLPRTELGAEPPAKAARAFTPLKRPQKPKGSILRSEEHVVDLAMPVLAAGAAP